MRVLLVLLLATVGGCASSVLLHPPQGSFDAPDAVVLRLPYREGTLEVLRQRADASREPRAFVLEFCGNATVAQYVVEGTAKRFAPVNAEVWAVNYPGYGGSTGPARLDAMAAAALFAYDELAKVAAGRPIFVVGRSIGTAVALHVASSRPVAGVVLHSPTPLKQVLFGEFGWWNLWIGPTIVWAQVPRELDAIESAKRCSAPAVFIVSERDTLVRAANQRRVVGAYAGPNRVVSLAEAGHNDAATEQEEAEIGRALRWLLSESKAWAAKPGS